MNNINRRHNNFGTQLPLPPFIQSILMQPFQKTTNHLMQKYFFSRKSVKLLEGEIWIVISYRRAIVVEHLSFMTTDRPVNNNNRRQSQKTKVAKEKSRFSHVHAMPPLGQVIKATAGFFWSFWRARSARGSNLLIFGR